MAYERAALSLRDLDEDLAAITKAGHLKEIPGIGDDLAEMIEYVKTRSITRYKRECRGIPDGLIELWPFQGSDPRLWLSYANVAA